jgi:hypothetical protein
MLRDLVETYNISIVGDPAGRELDQVRIGPSERYKASAVIDLAAPIADAVRSSDGLATALAIDVLTEQVEAVRTAPQGVDGDQVVALYSKTTTHFVIEALRVAYTRIRAEPAFAWKEYRARAYRGLGAVTAGGILGLPIISFVVNNAQALKAFVEHVYRNPALIHIINFIAKLAGNF